MINTGILSYGMSGRVFHAPLLHAHEKFNLLMCTELSKKVINSTFPKVESVDSLDAIIHDERLDLVVVNLPDHLHEEYVTKALEAGKHVVVEKPFVLDSTIGKQLINLAESKGKMLSVFQNRRWDSDFLTYKNVIESGVLGELVEAEIHYDRFRNFIQKGTWKEEDGASGTIFNLGTHIIDQAIVLFGKPISLFADLDTVRKGGKVIDYFDIKLYYDDVKVILKSSYLVKEEGPKYTVHGQEGSFLKYGIDVQEDALKEGKIPNRKDWGMELPEYDGILNVGDDFTTVDTEQGNYLKYYDGVFEAISSGDYTKAVNPKDSLLGVEIIEKCFESNEKRMVVHL